MYNVTGNYIHDAAELWNYTKMLDLVNQAREINMAQMFFLWYVRQESRGVYAVVMHVGHSGAEICKYFLIQ